MVSWQMRWVLERRVQSIACRFEALNYALDGAIHLAARLPRGGPRHLGTVPRRLACLHIAQLATGNHSFRTQAQGIALLGKSEGSCYTTQVLEQEGDKLRPGRAVSRPYHKLPTCECSSVVGVTVLLTVRARCCKTSSISRE